MRIYVLPIGTYWPDGRRLADCERTYLFWDVLWEKEYQQ